MGQSLPTDGRTERQREGIRQPDWPARPGLLQLPAQVSRAASNQVPCRTLRRMPLDAGNPSLSTRAASNGDSLRSGIGG
jgi:hypothetical protein